MGFENILYRCAPAFGQFNITIDITQWVDHCCLPLTFDVVSSFRQTGSIELLDIQFETFYKAKNQKSKTGRCWLKNLHSDRPGFDFLNFTLDLINNLFYATADLYNARLIQPVVDEFAVSFSFHNSRPP